MAGSTTTNAFYKEQMDAILLNATTALSGVTGFYVGLLNSNTAVASILAGTYSEVGTGKNYVRIGMNRSSSSGGGLSGFQYNAGTLEYSNNADIVFGVPSADWGTIYGVALFKAITGSDMLYYAALSSTKVVNAGDGAPKILAGQLRISRASC